MSKEENVVNYYVLCNKLKNLIRKGWIDWGVERERIESVAEHIYSVQMLAIAMNSEYEYDLNIYKVIMMLAIHELGEIKIGDLTQFQISKDEKSKIETKAFEEVVNDLFRKEEIINLYLEFESKNTKESLFAFYCDKLECDLQSKLYDEEKCVDLKNQENNITAHDNRVKRLIDEGLSWSEMWLTFGQQTYNYDDSFKSVSDYALKHSLNIKNQKEAI